MRNSTLEALIFKLGTSLICLWINALPADAATRTAASASYSDVSAAVASAVSGDTVQIPAGSATWSSTLNVGSKAINIIGAGNASTIITNKVGNLIKWSGTGANSIRLSGIRFNNSDNQSPIIALVGPISKVRIDHCIFDKGDSAIGTNYMRMAGTGPVYGVVDHCEFYNMKRAYFAMDLRAGEASGGKKAWSEGIFPGTDKMMYFEDNKFIWNSGLTDRNAQGALYGQYGGKACFRYNTCTGHMTYIDAHGDGPDESTVYYEIYNNKFVEDNSNGFQGNILWQRGGQWIVHGNTFTGKSLPVRMSVYWKTDAVAHRVKNTYIWGNTRNGNNNQTALVAVNDSGQTPSGYSAANIRLNIEYFLNAPQQGQTYFPYAPLAYPHPLVAADGGGGNASVNRSEGPTSGGDASASVGAAGQTTQQVGQAFDSTQGIVSVPFTVNPDHTISQALESKDPSQGGEARYLVQVTTAGDYAVDATVYAPDDGANSLFVNFNTVPISPDMIWDIPVNNGLTNNVVTRRGSGGGVQLWSLSAGVHTLILRGREAGVKVGQITIVRRPQAPQGLRAAATGQ
jgi:hypothetical protein